MKATVDTKKISIFISDWLCDNFDFSSITIEDLERKIEEFLVENKED